MRAFDRIAIDPRRRLLTVGPGATWGAIVARLQPLGLVPYVTVTTAHATAGGTLSGDCLSRFSPAYGKEGRHIEHFTLMTVDGHEHVCRAPAPGALPTTLSERLFCAVIGGLGYIGAVTSITHAVLHVGETRGRIGVESRVFKYTSFRELATELVPLVRGLKGSAYPTSRSRFTPRSRRTGASTAPSSSTRGTRQAPTVSPCLATSRTRPSASSWSGCSG